MKLNYKFNPKMQAVYGIVGFFTALAILYLILNRVEWITAVIVAIGNFLVSGFYTEYWKKC